MADHDAERCLDDPSPARKPDLADAIDDAVGAVLPGLQGPEPSDPRCHLRLPDDAIPEVVAAWKRACLAGREDELDRLRTALLLWRAADSPASCQACAVLEANLPEAKS